MVLKNIFNVQSYLSPTSSHDIFSSHFPLIVIPGKHSLRREATKECLTREPVGLSISDVGRHFKTVSRSGSLVHFLSSLRAEKKMSWDDDKGKIATEFL